MIDCEKSDLAASVVIPTRDRPQGLVLAVSSALVAARYAEAEIEVIVVDDNGSIPALTTLSEHRDPALTVTLNRRRPGPAGARNHGVDIARGQTVLFLDDDDALEEDYIARVLQVRATVPASTVFGFSSALRAGGLKGLASPTGILSPSVMLSKRLFPLSAGVWIDREVFQEIGGLDEELQINEDTDFCLVMASAGHYPFFDAVPGVTIDAGLERKGQQDRGSITKSKKPDERSDAFKRLLQKHASLLEAHPAVRRHFEARVAKYLGRKGRLGVALSYAMARRDGRAACTLAALAGRITRDR